MALGPDISRKVVSIGIDYGHSKGGVPEVERYHSELFAPYRFIATSIDGNKLKKALWGAGSLLKMSVLLALDRRIKIVHAHVCSGNSFWRKRVLIRLAKLMGKKVVFHLHGGGFADFFRNHPEQVRPVIDSCDHIIALSENWRSFFRSDLGYDDDRVTIIPNGILPPEQVRDVQPKKPGEKMKFLFLGTINEDKGIFDLVDVVAAAQYRYRGRMEITICGVGETDRLKKSIAEAGVSDIVHYGGWVSGETKAEMFRQTDVFILPSYYEGLPVCVLEAMSFGIPVIATTVGGIPDVVEHGVNGLLFTPGDKDALAQSLDAALDNPAAFAELGTASLPVIANYFPEKISRRLEALYGGLLNPS